MSATPSLREQIVINTATILSQRADPGFVLVTREPFDVAELAITQFPSILISFNSETRETVSMGAPAVGRRAGEITLDLRVFLRGNELDKKRNSAIAAVEDALESDRYLDLRSSGVLDSQITVIETQDRQPPLAEVLISFVVSYNYIRGSQA